MKAIWKIVMVLVAATTFTACESDVIWDRPEIRLEQESYTVKPEGGSFVIPVVSTGIDEVYIDYRESYYEWEVDLETGDRYPAEGWITVEQLIESYPATRDLPTWRQGVRIRCAPNESGVERQAVISISSFTLQAQVTITQPSFTATEE